MDLTDLYTRALSFRKVIIYTNGLRPGARIYKDWNQEQHLLADQVDLLTRIAWLTHISVQAGMNPVKPKALKKPPKPLLRPRDIELEKKPKKFTATKDLKRLLGG